MSAFPEPESFSDRMMKLRSDQIAQHVESLERLELEHLDFFLANTMAQRFGKGTAPDLDLLTGALAIDVLRHFFGIQWTNENLFSQHQAVSPENRAGREFMRAVEADGEEGGLWQERIRNLASLLFNLQSATGFRERLQRSMQKRDLESVIGELECARVLAAPHHRLRFIAESGTKGLDYEVEVQTIAGRVVCCEFKTKCEDTQLTSATVWRACDKGRRQLPEGKPGVIFIRIPKDWITQANSRATIEEGVQKAFRSSERLVGVVIVWETWSRDERGIGTFYCHTPIYNTTSPLFGPDIPLCLESSRNLNWLNLGTHVERRMLPIAEGVLAHLARFADNESPIR